MTEQPDARENVRRTPLLRRVILVWLAGSAATIFIGLGIAAMRDGGSGVVLGVLFIAMGLGLVAAGLHVLSHD